MTNNKLENLELLRGIAVLAVCFCHFGYPLREAERIAGVFKIFDEYGKYGVQIFFVISGFVIPLSLRQAKYTSKNFGYFLLKRVYRLHPPYIVALIISLLIGYASYRVRGIAFPENSESIFLSLFYLHVSDINPVFWTLVVEAQYYILIGLAYIWLTKYPTLFVFIGFPILLIIGQSPVAEYIRLFKYINFFLIGWAGFLIYKNQGSIKINTIGLAALLITASIFHETPAFLASLFTIIAIIFLRTPIPPALAFPGKLSYSLYLIHYPIGVKLINLASRYIDQSISFILFPIAMLVVWVLAYIFWHLIEIPSAKLSSKVKYAYQS